MVISWCSIQLNHNKHEQDPLKLHRYKRNWNVMDIRLCQLHFNVPMSNVDQMNILLRVTQIQAQSRHNYKTL
jgi:hypothetical protein